jgi:hypothetical protein
MATLRMPTLRFPELFALHPSVLTDAVLLVAVTAELDGPRHVRCHCFAGL